MDEPTNHEKARALLSVHKGACSVPALSPLGRAFMALQVAGEVRIGQSGTQGYIDVYAKDFAPRFSGTGTN